MRLKDTGAAVRAPFQLAGEFVSLCANEATGVMDRAEREAVMASILGKLVAVENDEKQLGKDNRVWSSLMTLI